MILAALSFALGGSVQFSGAFHGLVALIALIVVIVVIVTMVVAEEAVARLYRRLA